MDGFLGIAGWKWIYLIEAAPTILLGIGVLFYLTDKPEQARWLSTEEKAWLSTGWRRNAARWNRCAPTASCRRCSIPKVLLLCLELPGHRHRQPAASLLFVPQIIKSLGATNMGTGYATMLAYICGADQHASPGAGSPTGWASAAGTCSGPAWSPPSDW